MKVTMRVWFKLIMLYAVLLVAYIPSLSAMGVTGSVELLTGIGTNHISRTQAYFFSDVIPYVKGGITFTYPAGLFTQTPTLLVTLSLLGLAYSTSSIVVAEVVSTTSLSATV